jgi:ABC-type transport system involved in multi-copper enzyme maturation permease subunit
MAFLAIINDTVRQACSQVVFFALLGLAVILIILSGLTWGMAPEGNHVRVNLLGMAETTVGDSQEAALVVRTEYTSLWLVGGTLLFALAASFLVTRRFAPGIVELYLAMPVSRVTILAGMSVGIFVTFFAPCMLAIMGVWLVVGLKTGIFARMFLYPLLFNGLAGLSITALAVGLSTITRGALVPTMFLTLVWVTMFFVMPIVQKSYPREPVAVSYLEYGEVDRQYYEEQRSKTPALVRMTDHWMKYLCPPVVDLESTAVALEYPTGRVLTWRPVYVAIAQTLLGFALAGIWFARKDY